MRVPGDNRDTCPVYSFIRGPRPDSTSLATPRSWYAFALSSLSRLGIQNSSRVGPRESRATAAARRSPSILEAPPLVGLRPRVLGPPIQNLVGLEAVVAPRETGDSYPVAPLRFQTLTPFLGTQRLVTCCATEIQSTGQPSTGAVLIVGGLAIKHTLKTPRSPWQSPFSGSPVSERDCPVVVRTAMIELIEGTGNRQTCPQVLILRILGSLRPIDSNLKFLESKQKILLNFIGLDRILVHGPGNKSCYALIPASSL